MYTHTHIYIYIFIFIFILFIYIYIFVCVFKIIIPILLLKFDIELNLFIVPGFMILYLLFRFLNNNVHKLYLQKEDKEIEAEIEKESKWEKGNKRKTIKYCIILSATGILLFIIGELLGNTLDQLCKMFKVSEVVIGVLLGFITSLPELITFIESQKHHKDIEDDFLGVVEATNNLLTSNILNLFVIQTIGILIVNFFR